MRASWRWLTELSGVEAAPQEMAERLTRAGFEVEDLVACGGETQGVVVAEVRSMQAHAQKAQWQRVRVFDGSVEHEVICGAANVPAPGGRVLWAPPGARLLGQPIEAREFGGHVSQGMLCSERELGIGEAAKSICVLGDEDAAPAGTPLETLLPLADTVLDVAVTPNRPDALGHIGLAREVSLAFGQSFALPEVDELPLQTANLAGTIDGIVVEIADPDRCQRYGVAALGQLRIGPSPLALRCRLHWLGVRAIHNVVDITNETWLLWGHPVHAFDRRKLRGERLSVRRATLGERLTTLDGVARQLNDEALVIADAEGAVALAGIAGGQNSEVDETTREVLIECASFAPRTIRRTARAQGMATEASHRFERGVDEQAVPSVLADTVRRIQRLTGATCLAGLDVQPQAPLQLVIPLRLSRLEATLGIDIEARERRATFTGLGCRILATDSQSWQVEPPSWRRDLRLEIDLIEELGRVHGYERLPERLPRLVPGGTKPAMLPPWLERWRQSAVVLGLQEAVHHGFVASRQLAACGLPPATVQLDNPLSEERDAMRPSLLPGLAMAARRAHRHQVEAVALFEIGRTFQANPSPEALLPRQPWQLGIWWSGPRQGWLKAEPAADFFDAKGLLENLLRSVVGPAAMDLWQVQALGDDHRPGWAHPGKSARLAWAGTPIGVLGELHPQVRDALELEQPAIFAELDLEELGHAQQQLAVPQAQALPRFPAVTRDVALVVAEATPVGELAAALQQAADGLCEATQLFDLYHGTSLPEGSKSLAFRLRYRDARQTLTDARVDKVHSQVLRSVQERFGARQR